MTEETFLEIRNRIRPYRDEEVPRVIAELLAEPSFQAFLRIFPRDIATDPTPHSSDDFLL